MVGTPEKFQNPANLDLTIPLPDPKKDESWRKFSFKNFRPETYQKENPKDSPISEISNKDLGIRPRKISELSGSDLEYVHSVINRLSEHGYDKDYFHRFSLRSFEEGVFLDIPSDSRFEDVLECKHAILETGNRGEYFTLIRIGASAKLRVEEVFESVYSDEDGFPWFNSLTVLDLEDNAHLEFTTRENHSDSCFNFHSLISFQGRDSYLKNMHFYLGGYRSKLRQFMHMDGEGGLLRSLGLTCLGNREFVDHETIVKHSKNHTESSLSHKVVVKGRSHHVFTGNLHIPPEVSKVKAAQVNHNLSMDPTARAESIPMLEIFSEDVQSSHGSTVGEISDEELFYLLSRGIPREEAYHLLVEAFIVEIIDELDSEDIKTKIKEAIKEKIWPSE